MIDEICNQGYKQNEQDKTRAGIQLIQSEKWGNNRSLCHAFWTTSPPAWIGVPSTRALTSSGGRTSLVMQFSSDGECSKFLTGVDSLLRWINQFDAWFAPPYPCQPGKAPYSGWNSSCESVEGHLKVGQSRQRPHRWRDWADEWIRTKRQQGKWCHCPESGR